MPDSGFVIPPTARVVDASIAAVSGGKLKFYAAGTVTPLNVYSDSTLSTSLGSTVYTDSAGHPVASSGSSTKVIVYTGSALVKIVVTDSNDVTLEAYDNVKCAPDTSGFSSSSGSGIVGVKSKTSDYSAVLADDGYWLDCDPTGSSFAITLPNAATVGDGFAVGIRHSGTTTTNTVRFATVSSQTIDIESAATVGFVLTGGGSSAWLVSDGAGWKCITRTSPRKLSDVSVFTVEDRLTAPPASPTAGASYLINGTPTLAWSTASYQQHDIVTENGVGGWYLNRPFTDCGWLAYVKDENLYTAYVGTAWADQLGMAAAQSVPLKTARFQDQKANGTSGGATVAGAWTTRALNTSVQNDITGVSLAANQITIPAGDYLIIATAPFFACDDVRMRFKSTTTTDKDLYGSISQAGSAVVSGAHSQVVGRITLTAQEAFTLDYLAASAKATNGLGLASTVGTELEMYADVTIISLTALQGATGSAGAVGSIAASPSSALTLANGANSDIVISTNVKLRITGPSGAFSVSGFAAPANDGRWLVLYNSTAQNMTITNNATSSAANRILTMTGADVALTGASVASFFYDTTDARWILQSTQG